MSVDVSLSSSNRFAWLFDDQIPRNDTYDRVLLEYFGTKTVPSLGSIVSGWTLTFPSVPRINLSRCDEGERAKVLEAAAIAAKRVADMSKMVFHFEHGSGEPGSQTGCGLDLAHLHTVPLDFDLVEAASQSPLGGIAWQEQRLSETDWSKLPKEYLAVWRGGTDTLLVGKPPQPTSQYFRKLIADAVGHPDAWNYRAHHFMDNIRTTIQRFE